MKRFEFRLQAVLTLRQRAEQAALEAYAQALQQRESLVEQLRAQALEISETRRRWLTELADGCPAIRAAQVLAYCQSLEDRRHQTERELQGAESRLVAASQRMLSARQDREAVENLFHQQQSAHEATIRREEQKMLDDLVGRRSPVTVAARPQLRSSLA